MRSLKNIIYKSYRHNTKFRLHNIKKSSFTSSIGPKTGLVAALETKISMDPNFATVSFISLSRSSALATWQTTPWTFSAFLKFDKASCTLEAFRLLITTLAPSDSSFLEIPKPILKKYTYTYHSLHVKM